MYSHSCQFEYFFFFFAKRFQLLIFSCKTLQYYFWCGSNNIAMWQYWKEEIKVSLNTLLNVVQTYNRLQFLAGCVFPDIQITSHFDTSKWCIICIRRIKNLSKLLSYTKNSHVDIWPVNYSGTILVTIIGIVTSTGVLRFKSTSIWSLNKFLTMVQFVDMSKFLCLSIIVICVQHEHEYNDYAAKAFVCKVRNNDQLS